jgi:hypothetical protein
MIGQPLVPDRALLAHLPGCPVPPRQMRADLRGCRTQSHRHYPGSLSRGRPDLKRSAGRNSPGFRPGALVDVAGGSPSLGRTRCFLHTLTNHDRPFRNCNFDERITPTPDIGFRRLTHYLHWPAIINLLNLFHFTGFYRNSYLSLYLLKPTR